MISTNLHAADPAGFCSESQHHYLVFPSIHFAAAAAHLCRLGLNNACGRSCQLVETVGNLRWSPTLLARLRKSSPNWAPASCSSAPSYGSKVCVPCACSLSLESAVIDDCMLHL